MKKLNIFKIVHLILLFIITVFSILVVSSSKSIYTNIFSNPDLTILCGLIWILLVMSFLFLILDFTFFKNFKIDYNKLNQVAYSDPVSGIPNRYSCDVLIEKYINIKAPDNIGCVMIDLTNLSETSKLYGYLKGNELIKQFSTILISSSLSLCFVGRNGGNKFLAIFENTEEKKLNIFLERVAYRVDQINQSGSELPMKYEAGMALNSIEHLEHLTDLISLANRRITDKDA